MIEPEELIMAIFGVVFVLVLFAQAKTLKIRELNVFLIGAVLLLSASIFTILEGILWKEVFNFIEHLGYASAGICFAVGCSLLGRRFREEQDGQL